jgi:hypothetical protein
MSSEWKTLRVIVELPVSTDTAFPFGETDLRWLVERLIGGAKLHSEINRNRMNPIPTGNVRVKMWSKAKRWLV